MTNLKAANQQTETESSGKMKSKSNVSIGSIKTKGRHRLTKECIRQLLLNCSKKRNHLIEYLWIMSVKGNEICGTSVIEGGLHKVNFLIGDIADRLREDAANEFILIHNHPNGDPRPSIIDLDFISLLKKLKSKTFNVRDFLIFSEQYIYSHEWNKDLLEGEMNPIFWSEEIEELSTLWK